MSTPGGAWRTVGTGYVTLDNSDHLNERSQVFLTFSSSFNQGEIVGALWMIVQITLGDSTEMIIEAIHLLGYMEATRPSHAFTKCSNQKIFQH